MAGETYQHNSQCNENCDEFINTDCIVYDAAISYLGLEAGATQTEIIMKLVQALENLQVQINTHHPTV